MFVGAATHDACQNLIGELTGFLSDENACPASEIAFEEGTFSVGGRSLSILDVASACVARRGELSAEGTYKGPPTANPWDDRGFSGDAYKGYSWLATVVELEVDMDTYEANPIHTTAVAEIGRVIHPVLAAGQLASGVHYEIGRASCRERV